MEVNYGIRFTTNDELETFLKQLCTEVHARLKEIKRRAKSITLKYMIRAKDAPIETAKFMGHGVCDNVTKSHSLQDFTGSLDVIVKTVLQIKNVLNIPPEELRGIGVHIGRLDTAPDDNSRNSSNILKTMFDKVAARNLPKPIESEIVPVKCDEHLSENTKPVGRSLRNRTAPSNEAVSTRGRGRGRRGRGGRIRQTSARSVSTMLTNMKTIDPTIGNAPSTDFGDIDMSTLMELPPNIRQEIMSDYKSMATESKKQSKLIKCDNRDEIDPEFLAALPADIRFELMGKNDSKSDMELLSTVARQEPKKISVILPTSPATSTPKKSSMAGDRSVTGGVSAENVFVDSKWRTILKAWIESTDDPMPSDIDTVALYGNELISDNKLHELYVVLRYLYR